MSNNPKYFFSKVVSFTLYKRELIWGMWEKEIKFREWESTKLRCICWFLYSPLEREKQVQPNLASQYALADFWCSSVM